MPDDLELYACRCGGTLTADPDAVLDCCLEQPAGAALAAEVDEPAVDVAMLERLGEVKRRRDPVVARAVEDDPEAAAALADAQADNASFPERKPSIDEEQRRRV